jgi:hypothetical protein
MSIAVAAWCLVLALCAISLWIRRRRRRRNAFITRSGTIANPPKMAAMPNAGGALVYVNEDGSVRELTQGEKTYVATPFSPLDGARPHIKLRYFDRAARGIQGYLPRTQVPHGMPIHPPPQDTLQEQTPQAVGESLVQLVGRLGGR